MFISPLFETVLTVLSLTYFAKALSLSKKPVATNLERLATLMPRSMLAAPDSQLKYVVLGVGSQNYTCVSVNENNAPGTTGAVATLYDIGTKLENDEAAKLKIATLSGLALSLSVEPRALENHLRLQGYHHVIGHHFFNMINQANSPVFALDQLPQVPYPIAQVIRVDSTDAPTTAYPGLTQEGAIPWLYLADNANHSLSGIDTVYRLETAGGKPPVSCQGKQANFEVKYTAQYWIFGPKSAASLDKPRARE